jgi:hypothetical protein
MKGNFMVANLKKGLILSLLILLVGCFSMSTFDQYVYTQTTSLKVDALNVMDRATTDYASQADVVADLQSKLQKIYEYERNRPKNEISLQLWNTLLASDGNLLGGFLQRWKTETKLHATFISEEKKLVGKAFDEIAGLESGKIKASQISLSK